MKTILITGCSSGIGKHCALGLQAEGYRVFATARKPEDVQALTDLGLESLLLDLDDSVSIRDALTEILSRTGGTLDALFNNGAYGQPGAVEDLTRDVMRAQLETNLLGWLELTNLVLPVMRRQGHGRIVMNSSVLGLVALKYRGAYNCSKFALEGLTDTLRLELVGSNIYVSLIEPGPIESAFRSNAFKAFQDHIDVENSAHRATYEAVVKRLSNRTPGREPAFTLSPEAVLKPLRHALESRRPRPRYYVTLPTYFMGWMRRLLPTRWFDPILVRASD
ncbi:short-chain dehydrogenase/reductase [Marinobacterium zhoushanense]|uniref:Short-chain dehydrogenase/reductase n=1 Tax=Marinobacterium zhoushanense TaxID=1679163 RepID=A0ABQ1KX57_9GAMM|nr:SDR family oxidoreductase [Marinobacterium zhoushanense]GGC10274.1 short-chain dehydrogenase/reductase [Marinobacterium zhoushanense]